MYIYIISPCDTIRMCMRCSAHNKWTVIINHRHNKETAFVLDTKEGLIINVLDSGIGSDSMKHRSILQPYYTVYGRSNSTNKWLFLAHGSLHILFSFWCG